MDAVVAASPVTARAGQGPRVRDYAESWGRLREAGPPGPHKRRTTRSLPVLTS